MPTLREIRSTARGRLHQAMGVAANYLPVPNAAPVSLTVRVWRKTEGIMLGDEPGSSGVFGAERAASEDRVRFDLTEIPMLRVNGQIAISATEAYAIDHVYPANSGWQTARVTPLPASQAAALPWPGKPA